MGCGEGGGTLPSAPLRGAWGRRSLALDASATTVNFTPSGAEVAMELMSQRMSRSRSEHTRPRFGPAGAWICMHAAADVRRAGWSAAQGLAVARRAAQQVAERQKEWEGAFGRRGAGVGAMWCGGDVAWGRCDVVAMWRGGDVAWGRCDVGAMWRGGDVVWGRPRHLAGTSHAWYLHSYCTARHAWRGITAHRHERGS